MTAIHATTILALRHQGVTVFVSDGQVTVNNTIMKHTANKIRVMQEGAVIAGFAGSAADGFTLFERFESRLKANSGQLARAAIELAKDWRTDRALRRLEAMLLVGNSSSLYLLSGAGDVLQPDDHVVAIGSGGNFALSAARALMRRGGDTLSAREIAIEAMTIASEICPFTNSNFIVEEISK